MVSLFEIHLSIDFRYCCSQNVTFLEEAFGCVIVHQPNAVITKVQQLSEQMSKSGN